MQRNAIRLDVPAGTVLDYAGPTVPKGYIPCDGRALYQFEYPGLVAAIGTTWGGTSEQFNVPNLSGGTGITKVIRAC